MVAVVTFDPANLRIVEIGIGGDNVLAVSEVYSEWKDWIKLSDNAKYPQAFRFVGGDPVSGTQDLGITYFLMNGWRIRPAELSHKLTLDGNIFTDPFGSSVFVDTLGAFTVNAETKVSNLVDSLVAVLDVSETHLSVAYDGTTMEMGAWIQRRGVTVLNPISVLVNWYRSNGTLLFSQSSASADAQGQFELLRVQALVSNEGYYAVVRVTDAEGVVESRIGVPTVGP